MSDDIADRLAAVERLLSLHAEDMRTRMEANQDKQDRTISMLSEIAAEFAELARNDEKQWHAIADLRRGHEELVKRVADLETKPKRRPPARRK